MYTLVTERFRIEIGHARKLWCPWKSKWRQPIIARPGVEGATIAAELLMLLSRTLRLRTLKHVGQLTTLEEALLAQIILLSKSPDIKCNV
jgi:hypothetical protein